MPIGLLGGTFDPPHLGHLALGECARLQLGLDRVRFMPAGDPWRKAARDVSAAAHRLAMTRLAIAGNPHFEVEPRETARDGPTYTVETLRELHAEGLDDLVLILGAGALADMPAWREPEAIASLARLAVAPTATADDPVALAALAAQAGWRDPPALIAMPPLAISSTLLRERLRAGRSIRYLTPPAVEAYIDLHGLYR